MAKILSDRSVKRAIGKLILGAEEKYLNPNGIELRLGRHVKFVSTSEERQLKEGMFLRVIPGETVIISSLETLNFTREVVEELFPGSAVMGLITPTTTMMREGISQVSTKIDAGFRGTLNWSLRNSSMQDLTLEFGEPIYKLTLFQLDEDEGPESLYGQRERDRYQDSEAIARSRRTIPADIPKTKIVKSSVDKRDPKQHLREAGYPFNHIGTELTELHGKWEVVSQDVMLLKDEIKRLDTRLTEKIEQETKSLLERINSISEIILQKAETLVEKGVLRAVVLIVTILSFLGAIYKALLSSQPDSVQAVVFLVFTVLLGAILLMTRGAKR